MNANDVCRSVAKILDEVKLPWEQRQRFVAGCDLQCAGGPCYPECVPKWPQPRAAQATGEVIVGGSPYEYDSTAGEPTKEGR